jgi:cytoskeletal protein CcmA (bactofilin family)
MWKQDTSVNPPSPRPDQSAKAAPGDGGASSKVVMDLGRSVVIKGELSASEDLTLYGHMDGSVKLPDHTLTIGPDADIRAEVAAKAVVVMGALTGNVTASERVEIRATGSVTGDIASPHLAIVDGGCLQGKVEMPQPRSSQQARPMA